MGWFNLQVSKHLGASTFTHGALRPARDWRLKTKYLVAVRGTKVSASEFTSTRRTPTCNHLAIPSDPIPLRPEVLLHSGRRRRLPPADARMPPDCVRGSRVQP
jgi:hypothetical protein